MCISVYNQTLLRLFQWDGIELGKTLFVTIQLYEGGNSSTAAAIDSVYGQVEDPCNISANCTNGFRVSINGTGSEIQEGAEIQLICVQTVTNSSLMFGWKKNKVVQEEYNESVLVIEKAFSRHSGSYICVVKNKCCSLESSPYTISVKTAPFVLLLICGVSALALIVILGLVMKFKLKRDNARHRERRKQRAQTEQVGNPAPFAPRSS
ncbi:uncharacterized protein V6R79_012830 [Siganus canaliculatus]